MLVVCDTAFGHVFRRLGLRAITGVTGKRRRCERYAPRGSDRALICFIVASGTAVAGAIASARRFRQWASERFTTGQFSFRRSP